MYICYRCGEIQLKNSHTDADTTSFVASAVTVDDSFN